jgi:hypothetical protein
MYFALVGATARVGSDLLLLSHGRCLGKPRLRDAPFQDGIHCRYYLLARSSFGEITIHIQKISYLFWQWSVVNRQNEDLYGPYPLTNLYCCLESTEEWHAEIQNDKIGPQLYNFVDHFLAVSSHAAHGKPKSQGNSIPDGRTFLSSKTPRS